VTGGRGGVVDAVIVSRAVAASGACGGSRVNVEVVDHQRI